MRHQSLLRLASLLLVAAVAHAADPDGPARTCASLKQTALPNVTITVAEPVRAGAFVPPGLKPDQKVPPLYKNAPAFCRVAATLTPTPDSDIKVEVWMPASGWNGKFRGVGNGGFAGFINYRGLASAVSQGYAVASTDTGHSTEGAEWALGHPEKVIDYGYRAVHEMTLDAKTIVNAFYGESPKRSYFASCSNGGRQALMEAQRFPEDYDGIIAGAPANAWAPLLTDALRFAQALVHAGYIPPTKIPTISKAVLAACDAQDGVKDGVLNDPRQCDFDPASLLCRGKDSDDCLTAPQVASLKLIYAGAHDRAGKQIFPGLLPGGEDGDGGWKLWVTGEEEGKSLGTYFVHGYFADMVNGNKDWDFRKANVDGSLRLAYEKTGEAMNSVNPDLKAFFGRGGRLIMYHGWNDAAIPALNSVNYYNSVIAAVGGASSDQSMRLYMVPGMQHCSGGPGATSFGQHEDGTSGDAEHDVFVSLVDWVENGKAPGSLIATKYGDGGAARTIQMTRPLCPYPQTVKYKGLVDPNVAASFECVANK